MTDTTAGRVTASRNVSTAPAPSRKKARQPLRAATPWLFLIVPLAFLAVFTYIPVVNLVRYSFTSFDGVSPEKPWVGGKNFTELFTRPELFRVFQVSLYYLGASVLQMAIALYFATILSFNVRFKNLFKGILFFPYLINGVAIAYIFLFFFQPGGTLDSVLKLFSIGPQFWLGNEHLANYSLAGVSVWRYMGLNFVLFLGAIQSVSTDIYEAAELDGASKWQVFRHIILPSIRPIVSLSFILSISGSLAAFEIPFLMTGGSNGTATFVIQTVNLAFKFNKVGLASASALVLLAIVLLITWLQRILVPDDKVDLV